MRRGSPRGRCREGLVAERETRGAGGQYQNSSKFTEPERSVSNMLFLGQHYFLDASSSCTLHTGWKAPTPSRKAAYRIIMRTVCGSNGVQSPFTSAVLSSASVKLRLLSRSTCLNRRSSATLSFPSRGGAGVGGGLACTGGRPWWKPAGAGPWP